MYVLDYKKRLIENNHDIEDLNSISITTLAEPHWKKLSRAEKNEYEARAQTSVSIDKIKPNTEKTNKKLNCVKVRDVSELDLQKDLERLEYLMMVSDIKTLITDAGNLGGIVGLSHILFDFSKILLTLLDLDSLVLYFISTSSNLDKNKDICPTELAMAKYSLREGVYEDMQVHIPCELSIGSALSATEKSDWNSNSPSECEKETNNEYMRILEAMIKFLHPLDKLPIFFTEGNTRDNQTTLTETRMIISKIFYESQEDDLIEDLKIYPIEELLFKMQRMSVVINNRRNGTNDEQMPSIIYASSAFNDDNFMYLTKGCDIHKEKDVAQFCCLSKVRRYGYKISQWCINENRSALKEGKHFPHGFVQSNQNV